MSHLMFLWVIFIKIYQSWLKIHFNDEKDVSLYFRIHPLCWKIPNLDMYPTKNIKVSRLKVKAFLRQFSKICIFQFGKIRDIKMQIWISLPYFWFKKYRSGIRQKVWSWPKSGFSSYFHVLYIFSCFGRIILNVWKL